RGGDQLRLDLVLGKDLRDRARDTARVDDHRVNDDVRSERLDAERRDLDLTLGLLQLHRLDAARADVETYDRFSTAKQTHNVPSFSFLRSARAARNLHRLSRRSGASASRGGLRTLLALVLGVAT